MHAPHFFSVVKWLGTISFCNGDVIYDKPAVKGMTACARGVRAGRKNVTMRSRYKNVISALMGFDWCAYLTMLRCTKLRTPGATTFGPWPCQPAGWKKCDNPLCVRKALPHRPTSSCWWLAPVSALSLFVFTALVRALQF